MLWEKSVAWRLKPKTCMISIYCLYQFSGSVYTLNLLLAADEANKVAVFISSFAAAPTFSVKAKTELATIAVQGSRWEAYR